MKSYGDYKPKVTKVQVGDKVLEVRQFSVAKRDALVWILFEKMDIKAILEPFQDLWKKRDDVMDVLREKSEKEKREITAEELNLAMEGLNYGKLIATHSETLKSTLMKLLTGDVTRVDCIALDTPKNRETAGVGGDVEEDPDHGLEYSPEMYKWVKTTMDLDQEPEVLKAIIEVNKFGDLVKNYLSLVPGMAGGEEEETKEEADSTSK